MNVRKHGMKLLLWLRKYARWGLLIFAAFGLIWPGCYNWAGNPKHSDHLFAEWVIAHDLTMRFLIGALIMVANGLMFWDPKASREAIREVLNVLHQRYCPTQGKIDPEARATLFTEKKKGKLIEIYARSGNLHQGSKRVWNIENAAKEIYDSIASKAWVEGLVIKVDIKYDPFSDIKQYCNDTYLLEAEFEDLTWKSLSYRALAIKNSKDDVIAVLMFESKQTDGLKKIDDKAMDTDALLFKKILSRSYERKG